jgi:DNA-binding transcriptional ArsR family regulator
MNGKPKPDPKSAIVPITPETLRDRIYRLMHEKKITPDDPTYDVLLGEVMIAEELERLLTEAPATILKTLKVLQSERLVDCDRYLKDLRETAIQQQTVNLKEQESAIVKSVARLLQYAQSRAELKTWKDMVVPMTIMVTILFGSGLSSGWFTAAYLSPKPSPIAPGQPVKLTERQVESLKILEKSEGQLALDIVKYNPGKIDECLQSQSEILKKSLEVPTLGKVEYGACVLWLVPTEKRRFSP